MDIILYLVPLPLYLAYYRCKTGTWISSFRSFNYLMVLWLKKIRRQIENKAAEIWRCQYTKTHVFLAHCQGMISRVEKRNSLLFIQTAVECTRVIYVRWKMFFTHIQSMCLLQSQSYFNFFQPQMSFVQVRICPIFKH